MMPSSHNICAEVAGEMRQKLVAAERISKDRQAALRAIIVDSAKACTLTGCNHCKWLGNALGTWDANALQAAERQELAEARDGCGDLSSDVEART